MSKTSAAAAKASTSSNHFELFGLAPAFSLDREALEKAYRDIQSRVHPDRFAHAGDAERRASLQWTSRVNEAYRALRDPVQRAKHLLELNGVDVQFETNTQMPTDFLLQQLDVREQVADATRKKDGALLERIRSDLLRETSALEARIADAVDRRKDYEGAAEMVRKLMFLSKLDEDIDAACEAIE